MAACVRGKPEAAVPLCAKALGLYDAIQNRNCCAHCIDTIADLVMERGNPTEAATLLGAAAALRQQTGVPVPPYESFMHNRVVTACAALLTPEEFAARRSDGQRLDYPTTIERARRQLVAVTA